MEKTDFKKALEELRKQEKRNFKQSIDLIINLAGIDLKKPEEQVDIWVQLPHKTTKKTKVCALVGAELGEQAKKECDKAILQDDFQKFTDKKALKKLANDYDFFIAQANIMPEVAKRFGRILGPRGKMPNPKAGCVVPPNANLKPLVEKLRKTLHLTAKTELAVKCLVGTEEMDDMQAAENAMAAYNAVMHALPQEDQNIKNVMLKFTMSRPEIVEKETKKSKKAQEEPKKEKKMQKAKQADKETKKEPEKTSGKERQG